jgi:hypothetical protein
MISGKTDLFSPVLRIRFIDVKLFKMTNAKFLTIIFQYIKDEECMLAKLCKTTHNNKFS